MIKFLFLASLFLANRITMAQVTKLDNQRPATSAFLGWDGTGTNPGALDIKNAFTSTLYPINFFIGTNQKMILDANGKLGIGTTSPSTLLHLYNSAASTNIFMTIENTQAAQQAGVEYKTGTTNANWLTYIPASSTDFRLYRGIVP